MVPKKVEPDNTLFGERGGVGVGSSAFSPVQRWRELDNILLVLSEIGCFLLKDY